MSPDLEYTSKPCKTGLGLLKKLGARELFERSSSIAQSELSSVKKRAELDPAIKLTAPTSRARAIQQGSLTFHPAFPVLK